MQEEDKWSVSAQVPVYEGERELDEQSRKCHEHDGEAQPSDVVGSLVSSAQEDAAEILRQVQHGKEHVTVRRRQRVMSDHQYEPVLHERSAVLQLDV